jgi:hypothetical protein
MYLLCFGYQAVTRVSKNFVTEATFLYRNAGHQQDGGRDLKRALIDCEVHCSIRILQHFGGILGAPDKGKGREAKRF